MSGDIYLLHFNIRSFKTEEKLKEIISSCSKPSDIIAVSETEIKEY